MLTLAFAANGLPAQAKPATPTTPLGPAVFFTDVTSGPQTGGPGNLGVPIAIFGIGFGAARGTSMVTINGTEAASYLIWGERNANNAMLDMIVVQPGPNATAGPVVVTVGGHGSNATHVFTPTTGNVFAVAPTGLDTNPCSLAQPCATILHAATEVMHAGDALLVRGGSLNDDEIWIRDSLGHSGQPGQSKVIRNYPGETPVFTKVNRPVILDANEITFSGFKFTGGKSIGVGDVDNHGNRVVNNTFEGVIGYDAIGTHGNNHVLAGNTCNIDPSSVGTQGHCYYISHGSGIRLLYNVARGASGYGIHIFDQQRSTNDFTRVISDVLIEGNLLTSSLERSGLIIAMSDEGKRGNFIAGITIRNNLFIANNFAGVAIGGIVRNVNIEHNTFYQNGLQGITLYDEATVDGITITNNLFDQTANTNCTSNCSWYVTAHIEKGAAAKNVVVSHNFYAPGPAITRNITDDAPATGASGFVNPATLDFHLQANSLAINVGKFPSAISIDFDGQPRPLGLAPDAGAFEYLPTVPLKLPLYLPILRRS